MKQIFIFSASHTSGMYAATFEKQLKSLNITNSSVNMDELLEEIKKQNNRDARICRAAQNGKSSLYTEEKSRYGIILKQLIKGNCSEESEVNIFNNFPRWPHDAMGLSRAIARNENKALCLFFRDNELTPELNHILNLLRHCIWADLITIDPEKTGLEKELSNVIQQYLK